MSDERWRITTFHAWPQLTHAETRKGEIRFEIEIAKANDTRRSRHDRAFDIGDWVDGLRKEFADVMHGVDPKNRSIEVLTDENDLSKVTVVYRTRSLDRNQMDKRGIIGALSESGVRIDNEVVDTMEEIFATLREFGAQDKGGAVAAEDARRRASEKPRGPRSR